MRGGVPIKLSPNKFTRRVEEERPSEDFKQNKGALSSVVATLVVNKSGN